MVTVRDTLFLFFFPLNYSTRRSLFAAYLPSSLILSSPLSSHSRERATKQMERKTRYHFFLHSGRKKSLHYGASPVGCSSLVSHFFPGRFLQPLLNLTETSFFFPRESERVRKGEATLSCTPPFVSRKGKCTGTSSHARASESEKSESKRKEMGEIKARDFLRGRGRASRKGRYGLCSFFLPSFPTLQREREKRESLLTALCRRVQQRRTCRCHLQAPRRRTPSPSRCPRRRSSRTRSAPAAGTCSGGS